MYVHIYTLLAIYLTYLAMWSSSKKYPYYIITEKFYQSE